VFLDTNLLVLLVVGSVDRGQVERHRRTKRFTVEDYDRLVRLLEGLEQVFVTPNTLTEASNLLERRGDPRFLNWLNSWYDYRAAEGDIEELCVTWWESHMADRE